MNILLAGASGQLGQELLTCLAGADQVICVDRAPGAKGSIVLDLSDLGQVEVLLNRQSPDVVINAAAYTAVDQAENDDRAAFRMNAELPACLARWCRSNGSFLLHYSTDYIFNGESQRPYREDDPPGPLGVYGESKLAGEWAVGASRCRNIILRTSWVYSTHGKNFVLNMLRLARQRSDLSVVSDQKGCPTWARNLARASCIVLRKSAERSDDVSLQGVYHYCDSTELTWYEFASRIFAEAAEQNLLHAIPRLRSINSTEFPQAAQRPAYSVLDTTAIREKFGIEPPGIETSLRDCLAELSP